MCRRKYELEPQIDEIDAGDSNHDIASDHDTTANDTIDEIDQGDLLFDHLSMYRSCDDLLCRVGISEVVCGPRAAHFDYQTLSVGAVGNLLSQLQELGLISTVHQIRAIQQHRFAPAREQSILRLI